MKEEWHKYFEIRAPRYTSYPSALHFDTSISSRDISEKLSELDIYAPISLYVHVPFCRQLCWYCGCNMKVENYYHRAREYVDMLVRETGLLANHLNGRGRITSVHFGGGTPNYLAPGDLERILSAIEREFGLTDNADLAIELDPRMLQSEDVAHLASLGFGRVSLGIQDFDVDVQQAINRVQSYELIEACVSDIRSAGINDLSFDVLYGLPKQDEERFSRTIESVLSLAPDRVSVFGYAHLPSALPHQRMINTDDLPSAARRYRLSEIADEALVAAGYVRAGFDHYAKPDNALAKAVHGGRLYRNFQGFTEDSAPTMLGLGASAISFIDGIYGQNEKAISEYIATVKKGELPIHRGLSRTKRETLVADAISGLLCTSKANVSAVLRGAPPSDAIKICRALEQLEQDGVIRWSGDIIEIQPGAHKLSRAVAAAIDPYAQPQPSFAAAI